MGTLAASSAYEIGATLAHAAALANGTASAAHMLAADKRHIFRLAAAAVRAAADIVTAVDQFPSAVLNLAQGQLSAADGAGREAIGAAVAAGTRAAAAQYHIASLW